MLTCWQRPDFLCGSYRLDSDNANLQASSLLEAFGWQLTSVVVGASRSAQMPAPVESYSAPAAEYYKADTAIWCHKPGCQCGFYNWDLDNASHQPGNCLQFLEGQLQAVRTSLHNMGAELTAGAVDLTAMAGADTAGSVMPFQQAAHSSEVWLLRTSYIEVCCRRQCFYG
mmetsp:Transcript_56385/g.132227  ORF Transcript_56385/g.132227 Transcript_56385/m.132227 type:complete len:170 (+) Transcript_56385:274-783(+)